MNNFNKGWRPSDAFVRSKNSDKSSSNVHFELAQRAAKQRKEEEKTIQSTLQENFLKVEINDSFFTKNKDGINCFSENLYLKVLEIMCFSKENNKLKSKSESQLFIERKLLLPTAHKEIRVLENFGIKKYFLDTFLLICGLDRDVIDTVIFMLQNDFFTREEVLKNLALVEPISFYNPSVVIDIDENNPNSGFSAASRSKIAQIPAEIRAGEVDAMRTFVEERFNRLKAAVREDYFKRMKKLENQNNRSLELKKGE